MFNTFTPSAQFDSVTTSKQDYPAWKAKILPPSLPLSHSSSLWLFVSLFLWPFSRHQLCSRSALAWKAVLWVTGGNAPGKRQLLSVSLEGYTPAKMAARAAAPKAHATLMQSQILSTSSEEWFISVLARGFLSFCLLCASQASPCAFHPSDSHHPRNSCSTHYTLHTPNYAQKLYKPYTKPYIPLIINTFLCV